MKKGLFLFCVTAITISAGAQDLPKICESQFFGNLSKTRLNPVSDLVVQENGKGNLHKIHSVESEKSSSPWITSRRIMAQNAIDKREVLDSVIGYDEFNYPYTRQLFKFDNTGHLVSRQNAYYYSTGWETVEDYQYVWNEDGLILSESCIGYGSGMKYDYTYNERGLGIEKITSYYNGEEWLVSEKGEYQYDNEANLIDELLSIYIDGQWQPISHSKADYTTLNRQTSYENYFWNGAEWEGTAKEKYAYLKDYYDILTKMERYVWIASSGEFRNADVINQDFNENDKIILQQRLFWNEDRQDWSGACASWNTDICYNVKSIMAYDSRNRLTEDVTYYDYEGDGTWTKAGDMLYSYTDLTNGNYRMSMVGNLYMVYPGEVFNDQCRYALYDADGRNLWMLQQVRNSLNSDLINDFEEKCEYDKFGNITRYADWNWNGLYRIPAIREISSFDNNGDISEQNFFAGEENFSQLRDSLVGEPEWDESDDEGWENLTRFVYEYTNGVRVSKMGWIWNGNNWSANFGSAVEYDFSVPSSEILSPYESEDPYKIISTADYSAAEDSDFIEWRNIYYYSEFVETGLSTIGNDGDLNFDGIVLHVPSQSDITVADTTGRVVLTATGSEVRLSSLGSGVYVVTAHNQEGIKSMKIIVR